MYTISTHLPAPPAYRSPREPLFYTLSADLQPPDEICSICREQYQRRARSNLNPEAPVFVPSPQITRLPLIELVQSRRNTTMLRAPSVAAIGRVSAHVSRHPIRPPPVHVHPHLVRHMREMAIDDNTAPPTGTHEEALPVTVVTARYRSYSEQRSPVDEECTRMFRRRARSEDPNASIVPTNTRNSTIGNRQTFATSEASPATPITWTQYVHSDPQGVDAAEEREATDTAPVRVGCQGNHIFHLGCLVQWFRTIFTDGDFDAPLTCPICRYVVRERPRRDRALVSEHRLWNIHRRRPQIALHFWFPTFLKCLERVASRIYPLHQGLWDDTEAEDDESTRLDKLIMVALKFVKKMVRNKQCPTFIAFWKPDPNATTVEMWTNMYSANVFETIDKLLNSEEVVAIWHGLLYRTALLGLWAQRNGVDPLGF